MMNSYIRPVFTVVMAGFFISVDYAASAQSITHSTRSQAAISKATPELSIALEAKGLKLGNEVFLRIVKSKNGSAVDGYAALFVENDAGIFKEFRRRDICKYSGQLGPKLKQGDGQAPEGFYFVKPGSFNPYSSYHLSFNLGYPNAYDRHYGRTGDYLMVHGKCVSIGCYAMGDFAIEQIYTLMDAAYDGGQNFIRVHIFPFEMSASILDSHRENTHYTFWQNLKQGWDAFEDTQRPPNVNAVDGRYMFD